MTKSIKAASLFASLLLSGAAFATPTTIAFSGVIGSTDTFHGNNYGLFVGKEFSGSFLVDFGLADNTVDTYGYQQINVASFGTGCMVFQPDGACQQYARGDSSAPLILSATIQSPFGKFDILPRTDGNASLQSIVKSVVDYAPTPYRRETYTAGSNSMSIQYTAGGSASTTTRESFFLSLVGENQHLFSDVSDIATLPVLSGANALNSFMFESSKRYETCGTYGCNAWYTSGSFMFSGSLTSLRVVPAAPPAGDVPEPSSILLVIGGLAALMRLQRARQ